MCRREVAERLLDLAREDGFLTYQHQCAQSPYIPLNGNKPAKDFSQFALSSRFRYDCAIFGGTWRRPGRFLCAGWKPPIRKFSDSSTDWNRAGGKANAERPLPVAGRCGSSTIPSRTMPRSMATYLYFLQQGDSVLAAHFAFTCGGGYYPLKVAYDEKYSQYGPGHLIIGAVLQDCAARGLSEFDCLGHWTKAKAKWASQVRLHNCCYIFRRSLSGRMLRAQTRIGHRLGVDIRRLKHLLGIARRGHVPPIELSDS